MHSSVPFFTIVGLLLACGGASKDQLRARAAFDLNCPEEQVTVVEIDQKTRGVRACGQQATYVEICDAPAGTALRECTWVLNTDSRPTG